MKFLIVASSLLFFSSILLSCTKEAKLNEGDIKEVQSSENSIVEENDQCICPKDFRPVCGSDGVTYPNACQAGCDGVADFSEGSCEDESLEYESGSDVMEEAETGEAEREMEEEMELEESTLEEEEI